MSLDVVRPPTFAELLNDPVMRKVQLTAPRLPIVAPGAKPWRVWGVRKDGKWAGKLFADYREAFVLVKKMNADRDTYADVVLSCRPQAFAPSFLAEARLQIEYRDHEWCGYCRRPTVYQRMAWHASMRTWPVVGDEVHERCWYCANKRRTDLTRHVKRVTP